MGLSSLVPDPGSQKVGTVIIGLISIFSAILITLNQYVKSQQMMEAHRATGLAYSKLYRNIMNELSLRRDQRTNGLDFIKMVRVEIDRLESTAPSIPPHIIMKFNKQFADSDIEKPEITGDLDPVQINNTVKIHTPSPTPRSPLRAMLQMIPRVFGKITDLSGITSIIDSSGRASPRVGSLVNLSNVSTRNSIIDVSGTKVL
jgi:hypothetical protein